MQGTRLIDSTPTALLPVEAVGQARVPGVAAARDQPGTGLEYGQGGAWTLETEQESWAVHRATRSILRRPGLAEAVREEVSVDLISRTAVYAIRLSGGVTGKAREGLPMSIRHEFHRSGKEVRQQQWSLAK